MRHILLFHLSHGIPQPNTIFVGCLIEKRISFTKTLSYWEQTLFYMALVMVRLPPTKRRKRLSLLYCRVVFKRTDTRDEDNEDEENYGDPNNSRDYEL